MKRLTMKFVLSSFLVMFVSGAIPNIIWRVYAISNDPSEVTAKMVLFVGVITAVFSLAMYSFMIDRLILRRLSKLNQGTKEIMKGNYDIYVDGYHNDEVTDLVNSFNLMTRELKTNEYLNKEFVRNFSHELKTPLSAIKGYADLINNQQLTPKDIQEYSCIISAEADRLSSLSKNMLQISLVDSQGSIQKKDNYNVTEQIRNVIQLMQLDWEAKELLLDLHMEEVVITSNKEFTYQIWTNLLSNAIKFSNNADTITLRVTEESDRVRFDITNRGVIIQEDKDKVFNLFFVSEQSRTSKSNGVGLTLTKKIVEKLNGVISFVSEEDLTTFTIELPLY